MPVGVPGVVVGVPSLGRDRWEVGVSGASPDPERSWLRGHLSPARHPAGVPKSRHTLEEVLNEVTLLSPWLLLEAFFCLCSAFCEGVLLSDFCEVVRKILEREPLERGEMLPTNDRGLTTAEVEDATVTGEGAVDVPGTLGKMGLYYK